MANKKTKKSGKSGDGKQNQLGGSQKQQQQQKTKSKGLGSGSAGGFNNLVQALDISTKFAIRNIGTSGDIVTTGSELIGVAASGAAGAMVFLADLNPGTWGNTRVAQMVTLFETYKVLNLTVTYIPACPNTTGGMIYMYYDRDPNDQPISDVSTAAGLSRLMSNQNAVAGQVWKPLRMRYTSNPADAGGYFPAPVSESGDLRHSSQGVVYAYASATGGAIVGGLFKFEYTIQLRTPTGAVMNKFITSPWSYTPAQYNTTAAGTVVVPGLTGAPVSVGIIMEYMTDFAISVVVGGIAKTLAPYTPLFLRKIGTVYQTFATLSAAIAWADALQGPVVATAGNAWWRNVANVGATVDNTT